MLLAISLTSSDVRIELAPTAQDMGLTLQQFCDKYLFAELIAKGYDVSALQWTNKISENN